MNIKFRALIITAIASMFFLYGVAQDDVASLNINGKSIGEVTVGDKPAVLSFEPVTYKDATKAVLSIRQKDVVSAYKRSITVTDENENELFNANESKSEPGIYNINIAAIRQKISDRKTLKVYLLEDPVNEKMSIPSRKKLMVELHMK